MTQRPVILRPILVESNRDSVESWAPGGGPQPGLHVSDTHEVFEF